jgi:hypothetical protein
MPVMNVLRAVSQPTVQEATPHNNTSASREPAEGGEQAVTDSRESGSPRTSAAWSERLRAAWPAVHDRVPFVEHCKQQQAAFFAKTGRCRKVHRKGTVVNGLRDEEKR